jgi:dTDP-4-dehydrorhamnose 3,5-epimerase
MVKLVLYDGRVNSDTHREIVELFIGEANPLLVRIPSWVWHGFKNIGIKEAIVLNAPSVEYNASSPDEDRLLPSCDDIPYNWGREDK